MKLKRILVFSVVLTMLIQGFGATIPGMQGVIRTVSAENQTTQELPAAIDASLLTCEDIDANSVKITKYNGSDIEVVVLPEKIGEKTVTAIGASAFKNHQEITAIYIPDTVTSIGEYAFDYCIGLKTVDLGTGIKTIDKYAFDDTAITEIVLPENLSSLGNGAFRNTTSLSKITILGNTNIDIFNVAPFSGATALKEVVFGEKVTGIGIQMFSGTGIESIVIPDTVTNIGENAFDYCTELKTVDFGKGVTTIDDYAFEQCGLESVTLPTQLTTLGSKVFGECSFLTKVTLLGTLSSVEANQFWDCDNLSSVIVGKDAKSVPKGMFRQTPINSVMFLGDGTSIGDEAFGGCDNLQNVYFAGEFYDIHEDAFFSTPNAVMHTSMSSDALIAAVHSGLIYDYAEAKLIDDDDKYLDVAKSEFYVSDVSQALGTTQVTTQYAFKENVTDLTGCKLRYYLPNVEVKTVTLNGVTTTDFTYANSELLVPVTETSGEVVIELNTASLSQEQTVYVRMLGDNMQHEETIGVMTLGNGLTLNAATVTTSEQVGFDGVAYKDAIVTVYVNDEQVAKCTANKLGYYEGAVSLSNVAQGKKYALRVETTYDENTVSEEKVVIYDQTQPELTGFDFYYSTIHYGDYRKLDLMTCAQNAMVYFAPAHGYQFKVTFNNRKSLNEVYVVSRKNGESKYMQAQWDNDMQCYYAEGFFDENNKNYVPGDLTVFYTTKHEMLDYSQEENLKTLIVDKSLLPSHLEDAEVEVTSDPNSESEFQATITLKNAKEISVSYTIHSTGSQEDMTEDLSNVVATVQSNGEERNGVYYYAVRTGNKLVSHTYSPANKQVISTVVDGCDALFNTDFGTIDDLLFPESSMKFAATCISTMYDIDGNAVEWGLAVGTDFIGYVTEYRRIFESNLSDAEKEKRYAELNAMWEKQFASATMNLTASLLQDLSLKIFGSGNVPIAAGVMAAALLLEDYAEWYSENATGNVIKDLYSYLECKVVKLKFLIDPSGYVYEGVTDNYLSGVTATIYYKMAEEEEPQIWNAAEYSQINPQVTDSSGYYAWDVPEALWRVKYEKDGYETVYSDWMEVPPIRTNVNIGLVSTATPKLQSVLVYKDRVKIAFSQYMYPETVKGITLTDANGNILDYTLEYDQTRKNADEEVLATHFDMVLQNAELVEGTKLTVSVPTTVLNYAQNAMVAESNAYTVQEELSIQTVETVNVAYADTISVPFRIAGYTGEERIQIVSGAGCFINATLKTVDESGCGYVDITGTMKGEVQLILAIENTDITTMLNVCVVEESDSNIQLPGNDSDGDDTSKDDEPKDDTVKDDTVKDDEPKDDTVKDDENQDDTSKDEDKKQEESKEEQQTPPHEHTIVVDAPVAATFDQDGSTEGSHCSTCGEVIVASQVIPRIQSVTLNKLFYTYNGRKQTPKVTVKDSQGTRLVSNTDYVVAYAKGRKNVGVYSVTVTFKGKYAGVKEQTFTILPKATSLTKITAKKKGFTAKWKKQSKQVTGYELQYSINKKFTKKTTKTVNIGKNKTITKTISKLKAKKKYYVRIRTYKIVKIKGKNTKLYSKWSKVKTVKTKK